MAVLTNIEGDAGDVRLDLEAVVASALELAPLPASVGRLAALVADETTDVREIVEVIAYDQALTGHLLSGANSAISSPSNAVRTVHEAVIRLGLGTVLSLAMASAVGPTLRAAVPEYGLEEHELWIHSVRSTLAAEIIRTMAKVEVPAEVATAALLHDLGKLVLSRFLRPGILELIATARQVDALSESVAEGLLLEVNHAELGGLVAQHWHLPDSIVHAISYHHQPSQCAEVGAYVTHLANHAAHEVAETLAGDEVDPVASMRELGIDRGRWEELCATVANRYEELSGRFK